MLDPVQILFDNLTSMLRHAVGEMTETDQPCTCCRRPAAQFGYRAVEGQNCYKQPTRLCEACAVMFVTDPDLMGVERLAGGTTPIGQKFGMWSGVGWVHEVNTGRSVLMAPPGVTKKLPATFTDRVEVAEMTSGKHLAWIAKQNFSFPLLYIADFGRKTDGLMSGLAVSYSDAQLVRCDDSGVSPTTASNRELNLGATLAMLDQYMSMSSSDRSAWRQSIARLARGQLAPKDATLAMNKLSVGNINKLLPLDPHKRLAVISLLDKLAKEAQTA